MYSIHELLTKYCQLLGYSSCNNLSLFNKVLLFGVAAAAVIIVSAFLRRLLTGISK